MSSANPISQQIFGSPLLYLMFTLVLWGGALVTLLPRLHAAAARQDKQRLVAVFILLIGASALLYLQQPEQALKIIGISSLYQLSPAGVTLLIAVVRAVHFMIVVDLCAVCILMIPIVRKEWAPIITASEHLRLVSGVVPPPQIESHVSPVAGHIPSTLPPAIEGEGQIGSTVSAMPHDARRKQDFMPIENQRR